MNQPKLHHYIPRTYLKHFCNAQGTVLEYRKADPIKPEPRTPKGAGARTYYYSQYSQDGTRDHASVEQMFSQAAETGWDDLVAAMVECQVLTDEQINEVAVFVALQHARVPAIRDAHEKIRADSTKHLMRHMERLGMLPPMPDEISGGIDGLNVLIDPQTSIANMGVSIDAVKQVLNRVTFRLLHNRTETEFLTCDNPVIWFDPSMPTGQLRPYTLQPGGPAVFLFPITPRLMLYGDSASEDFGWNHIDLTDEKYVSIFNETIVKFGYDYIYSRESSCTDLIASHSKFSPVMTSQALARPDGKETIVVIRWEFGPREMKPKWVEDD